MRKRSAEAVTKQNMRFVQIKTQEQLDWQAMHRVRDRLMQRRTALINEIRGFLLERGLTFAPLEKFVVMLPRSMKFQPKAAGIFESMPGTTPDNVQGTPQLRPDQVVAFRISGVGTLEELEGRRQEAQSGKTDPATRPGGGIGPPIEAPDPLQKYRLPILAGAIVLMGGGAAYVVKKTRLARTESHLRVGREVPGGVVKKQASRRRVNRRHRQRARL